MAESDHPQAPAKSTGRALWFVVGAAFLVLVLAWGVLISIALNNQPAPYEPETAPPTAEP